MFAILNRRTVMRRLMMAVMGVCVAAMALSTGLMTGCDRSAGETGSTQTVAGRCEHEIKEEMCPFCNPEMVEQDGFCGEHGVAEALCAQCRPYLKAAFRAQGDWCVEHGVPESQCVICNPELKEKIRPGEHGTATTGGGAAAAPPADACEH